MTDKRVEMFVVLRPTEGETGYVVYRVCFDTQEAVDLLRDCPGGLVVKAEMDRWATFSDPNPSADEIFREWKAAEEAERAKRKALGRVIAAEDL